MRERESDVQEPGIMRERERRSRTWDYERERRSRTWDYKRERERVTSRTWDYERERVTFKNLGL